MGNADFEFGIWYFGVDDPLHPAIPEWIAGSV
jgi:hypothetical protein